uniref:AP2/ERF domain-containing protein n=1 Tax=Oryza meridionalis TaxID=40149 RepID=A0A0E0E8J6_9ORYZ
MGDGDVDEEEEGEREDEGSGDVGEERAVGDGDGELRWLRLEGERGAGGGRPALTSPVSRCRRCPRPDPASPGRIWPPRHHSDGDDPAVFYLRGRSARLNFPEEISSLASPSEGRGAQASPANRTAARCPRPRSGRRPLRSAPMSTRSRPA